MSKIEELDNKYIVVKWEDVFNRNILSTTEYSKLKEYLYKISEYRKSVGKLDNKYVVLNIDDSINLNYLRNAVNKQQSFLPVSTCKVGKIAVDLVNAIIIAENP